jgi:hypothetical protein
MFFSNICHKCKAFAIGCACVVFAAGGVVGNIDNLSTAAYTGIDPVSITVTGTSSGSSSAFYSLIDS